MGRLQIVNLCITNKDRNKFLLANRVKPPYIGYWGMLGGKVDEGEPHSIAASRELKEESGIESQGEFLGTCHERIFENGEVVYEFDIHFYLFVVDENIEFNKTVDVGGEIKWFDINSFEENNLIPSDPLMINSFLNEGKNKLLSFVNKIEEKYFQDKFEEWKAEKVKIGIDIDEVLAEMLEGFLEFYNKKHNTNHKKESFENYTFTDRLGGDQSDIDGLLDEFKYPVDGIRVVEGAIESVKKLAERFELVVVTARYPRFKECTEEFLKKHFGEVFSEIIYTGDDYMKRGVTKAELCKQRGIKYVIDDNSIFAKEIADKGVGVLLFDRPWNQNHESHENISRVMDWNDVIRKLEVETDGKI